MDGAPDASVFVISTDGNHFSSRHCRRPGCQPAIAALEDCGQRATKDGVTCEIFAKGRTIVWSGPVTFPDHGENGHLFALVAENTDGPGGVLIGGTAVVRGNLDVIYLRSQWGNNPCNGIARKQTGEWRVWCERRATFAGTFVEGARALYEGTGESTHGRKAWLTIFAKR